VNNVNIITISSDLGAGRKGAKLGPAEIVKILKNSKHILANVPVLEVFSEFDEDTHKCETAKNLESILTLQQNVLSTIQQALKNNIFPLILSGDHSNGAGVIAAVKDFYPDKTIGVIWIDAHADLHSPYTTPSGNLHGMPLAASLAITNIERQINTVSKKEEELWQKLIKLGSKQISPKISPENLVFIALRDCEEQEVAIINDLNIKHFNPQQIATLGIDKVAEQTLNHLNKCDLIIVSFDADSLDPAISSGTGTPVVNGLSINDATYLLKQFITIKNIAAFELTEVNPLLDRINPMEEVAANLLISVF
jgi:arginase